MLWGFKETQLCWSSSVARSVRIYFNTSKLGWKWWSCKVVRVNFLLWDEIEIRRIRRGSEADHLQAPLICFCFRKHLSFFLLLLLLGWLWLVRCLWLWVTPTTPKRPKCFCLVTSESASPGFQKWGDPSRSHQCTQHNQYNQYSALLSSPFQMFSIAAAMCRVVHPPHPQGIFHSWFKCSALSCFESINQSRCLVKEALRQGSWCFCSWKLFFFLFINTSVVTWCARLMPSCAHQGVPLKLSD